MSRGAEESSSGNKTILIVVCIVVAVLLVLGGTCIGLGYLFFRAMGPMMSSAMQMAQDMQMAPVLAEEFMSDLAANQVEAAYDKTSQNYRKRVSLEAFRKLIDKNPALKQGARELTNVQINPGVSTLSYTIHAPEGDTSCTLQLNKEGQGWKVEQVTIH
jgi:hypothetical protein